jgi:HNH endonuclease
MDTLNLTESSGFLANLGKPDLGCLHLDQSAVEAACVNPACERTPRWPRRGLCRPCYNELLAVEKATGASADHLFGSRKDTRSGSDPQQRLLNHIAAGYGGCWIYTGRTDHKGYGTFGWNGRSVIAHRAAYLLLVGPIPDGLTIDHLCRVRRCIRPDHLEPVTLRENMSRKPPKTHCPQGHPYSGDNVVYKRGYQTCRICRRAQSKPRTNLSDPGPAPYTQDTGA